MRNKTESLGSRGKVLLAAGILAAASVWAPVTAQAAGRTYVVEFRDGTHGEVNDSLAKQEIEYNGQVDIPTTEEVTPDTGYYFTGWNKDVEQTVTGKAVYVAQYARVINSVEYTIRYVDTAGAELQAKHVGTTEQGQLITAEAPQIDGYRVDAERKEARADGNGAEITFVYTTTEAPREVVEENVQTVNVPGDTNIVTETVPGTAAGAGEGAGTAAGAGTGTAAGTDTGAGTDAGTAAGAGTAADNQNPGGETGIDAGTETEPGTVIEDEEVPLADQDLDGAGSEEDGTTTIEEDEVPLANQKADKGTPVWVYGTAGGVLALAVIAGAVIAIRRKMK